MEHNSTSYDDIYFHKICCKDPSKTEIYIGRTTDFTRRQTEHKSQCMNTNVSSYTLAVYQSIRANGGWDNFDMILIERCNCENLGTWLYRTIASDIE